MLAKSPAPLYHITMHTCTTAKAGSITLIVSGRNNVYLIRSGKTSMLVDAGMTCMYANLLGKLEKLGARPGIIALTHAHYDHAENTYALKEHFKAKVLIHEDEAAHLAAGTNPEDDPFASAHVSGSGDENYIPVRADIIVKDCYNLDGITIIHTPGHTPGSICIIIDGEIAAVGDSMFSVHPGQAMVPYVMDRGVLLQSWRRLLDTKCSLFLPGHGRPITRKTVENVYREYAG
jgi:glyoxylase-like metal-dependent hydrolase (beta-lactamase superfamily II)